MAHPQTTALSQAPNIGHVRSTISLSKDKNSKQKLKQQKAPMLMSANRPLVKPNFEERTNSVVNRYSYSLPKKSLNTLHAIKSTFRSKQKHLGVALIQ